MSCQDPKSSSTHRKGKIIFRKMTVLEKKAYVLLTHKVHTTECQGTDSTHFMTLFYIDFTALRAYTNNTKNGDVVAMTDYTGALYAAHTQTI